MMNKQLYPPEDIFKQGFMKMYVRHNFVSRKFKSYLKNNNAKQKFKLNGAGLFEKL